MRVLVLGAGLLGVTSAYYLQQLGHEVTVVDRHAMPAAKARGRAAGASKAPDLRRVTGTQRPSRLRGPWSQLRIGVRRRLSRLLDRAVGSPPRHDPIEHLVRLAAYSRESVRDIREEAGLERQLPASGGLLSVFTDNKAFGARLARAPHWSNLGCEERLFTADEVVRLEPALQPVHGQLAGAAYAAEDPARDPAPFAASLVFLCRAAGVRFLTGHTVVALKEGAGRIDHVELLDDAGKALTLRADAYVLALGAASVPHAESLDIDLPLRFVREYIVTVPLKDPARAPKLSLRDRQGKLRIARIETPDGEALRVVATVRSGADEQAEPDSDRFQAMLRRIEWLFPGAVDAQRAWLDTEMHAVSTNRLPMIGRTRLANLFLNTAPGSQDWVHVCGAGKSIARIVSGLRPELDFAFRRP